jgi:signal peptidase II
MRALGLTALITFLLDQASKYYVVQVLDLKTRQDIDVLPPFLEFHMAWNTGVNFGLFRSQGELIRWVLIGVSLAIVAGVLVWMRKNRDPFALVAAGLLVGGALGNVVDRLVYGAVADFLNMSCCGIENPYSFNIADIAIFLGAVGLILRGDRSKANNSR